MSREKNVTVIGSANHAAPADEFISSCNASGVESCCSLIVLSRLEASVRALTVITPGVVADM